MIHHFADNFDVLLIYKTPCTFSNSVVFLSSVLMRGEYFKDESDDVKLLCRVMVCDIPYFINSPL